MLRGRSRLLIIGVKQVVLPTWQNRTTYSPAVANVKCFHVLIQTRLAILKGIVRLAVKEYGDREQTAVLCMTED